MPQGEATSAAVDQKSSITEEVEVEEGKIKMEDIILLSKLSKVGNELLDVKESFQDINMTESEELLQNEKCGSCWPIYSCDESCDKDSEGSIIPRLQNRGNYDKFSSSSSSDRSFYEEYMVNGTTVTDNTEPWTDSDDENSVQAEMVEIEGGALGGQPTEEICTRQGAATFNYDVNIQRIIEKEVAETVDINLIELKEQIKEEAEEEHPAAGGLLREPTVASRTDIVVYCDNLQDTRAWTDITNEIF